MYGRALCRGERVVFAVSSELSGNYRARQHLVGSANIQDDRHVRTPRTLLVAHFGWFVGRMWPERVESGHLARVAATNGGQAIWYARTAALFVGRGLFV